MFFDDIPDIVTSESLNSIEAPCHSGDTITLRIFLSNFKDPVFSQIYFPFNDIVNILGIGDILFNLSNDKVAFNVKLQLTSSSENKVKDFILIPSNILTADFNKNFLINGTAALCPPGSSFFLSAVGNDIINFKSEDFVSKNSKVSINGIDHSYSVVSLSLKLPDEPGFYNVSLGERHFSFFIAEMYSCHSIRFRNLFNAHEIIYISSSVGYTPTLSAQTAKSNGCNISYDLQRSIKIDFSAKNISDLIFQRIKLLPFGYDFHIDNIPVVISNLETKHSRNSADLFEVKFSAELRSCNPAAILDSNFNIFDSNFNFSFN